MQGTYSAEALLRALLSDVRSDFWVSRQDRASCPPPKDRPGALRPSQSVSGGKHTRWTRGYSPPWPHPHLPFSARRPQEDRGRALETPGSCQWTCNKEGRKPVVSRVTIGFLPRKGCFVCHTVHTPITSQQPLPRTARATATVIDYKSCDQFAKRTNPLHLRLESPNLSKKSDHQGGRESYMVCRSRRSSQSQSQRCSCIPRLLPHSPLFKYFPSPLPCKQLSPGPLGLPRPL